MNPIDQTKYRRLLREREELNDLKFVINRWWNIINKTRDPDEASLATNYVKRLEKRARNLKATLRIVASRINWCVTCKKGLLLTNSNDYQINIRCLEERITSKQQKKVAKKFICKRYKRSNQIQW